MKMIMQFFCKYHNMKMTNFKKSILENLKTLIGALIIAVLIRSLIVQLFIFHLHQWNQRC